MDINNLAHLLISLVRTMDINNSSLQIKTFYQRPLLQLWRPRIRIMDMNNSARFIDVTYSAHLLISIIRIMNIYNSVSDIHNLKLVISINGAELWISIIIRISDINKWAEKVISLIQISKNRK